MTELDKLTELIAQTNALLQNQEPGLYSWNQLLAIKIGQVHEEINKLRGQDV